MDKVEKYIGEARQKWTGNENKVATEIEIWKDTMKFAAEQVRKAEFDNAIDALDKLNRVTGRLLTATKNLKKASEHYMKTGEIQKLKFKF